MIAPTHGAVLDAESVKLLLPGDLLQNPIVGVQGFVCIESETDSLVIETDGAPGDRYHYARDFTFLGRPDADGWMPADGVDLSGMQVELRHSNGLWFRLARPTPEGAANNPANSSVTLPELLESSASGVRVDEDPQTWTGLLARLRESGHPAKKVTLTGWDVHLILANATPPAQPEPGAGELGLEYCKTATIRARQWFKDGDHPAVIRKSAPNRYADEGIPWCPTLEGGHLVTPGDWIATGVQGEHWPIKPDVFAATYALVGSGDEKRLSDPVSPLTSDLHKDTAYLVNSFAVSLAHKLLDAQRKYGYSNGWLTDDWEAKCKADLLDHVHKGDPLDVAAYAAFCWARNWSTTPADLTQAQAKIARLEGEVAAAWSHSRDLAAQLAVEKQHRLSAEADAAKVRERLQADEMKLRWAASWLSTASGHIDGKPGSEVWRAGDDLRAYLNERAESLAAQTERRA